MPTDVSSPFPQLDLNEGTIVTVTVDDPGAVVTALVVHGFQTVPSRVPDNPVPRLTLEGSAGGPGGT